MADSLEPRIVPPEEAREIEKRLGARANEGRDLLKRDLAHTAALLGEQRKAVLALLSRAPGEEGRAKRWVRVEDVAHALGVTA